MVYRTSRSVLLQEFETAAAELKCVRNCRPTFICHVCTCNVAADRLEPMKGFVRGSSLAQLEGELHGGKERDNVIKAR